MEDLAAVVRDHLTPSVNIQKRLGKEGIWMTVAWGDFYYEVDIVPFATRDRDSLIFSVQKLAVEGVVGLAELIVKKAAEDKREAQAEGKEL